MKNWRKSKQYRTWRSCVVEGKVCYICKTTNDLHAHHINHAMYFPDERFDVENGVALCEGCHSQYHNNYHRSNRTKCTKYHWDNFLSLVGYVQNL